MFGLDDLDDYDDLVIDDLDDNQIRKINKQVFNILKKSVDVDDPFYLNDYRLADCYFYGNGTKQNFDKAREYFLKCINDMHGDRHIIHAQFALDALDHDDPVNAREVLLNEYYAELDDNEDE